MYPTPAYPVTLRYQSLSQPCARSRVICALAAGMGPIVGLWPDGLMPTDGIHQRIGMPARYSCCRLVQRIEEVGGSGRPGEHDLHRTPDPLYNSDGDPLAAR